MAAVTNAITVNFQAQVVNGKYRESIAPGAQIIAQQNPGRGGGIQTVSHTTLTTLTLGVAVNGWMLIQNLDAANYVIWGANRSDLAMEPLGKLLAGEYAWVRVAPGVIIVAQADTGDVQVDVRALAN